MLFQHYYCTPPRALVSLCLPYSPHRHRLPPYLLPTTPTSTYDALASDMLPRRLAFFFRWV